MKISDLLNTGILGLLLATGVARADVIGSANGVSAENSNGVRPDCQKAVRDGEAGALRNAAAQCQLPSGVLPVRISDWDLQTRISTSYVCEIYVQATFSCGDSVEATGYPSSDSDCPEGTRFVAGGGGHFGGHGACLPDRG